MEAPPPRFQIRRQNVDQPSDSHDNWFTQRGATDEIREHLKHLGPSNLASRPRQTRYTSVKIKRSGNSPSRSAQTDLESGHSASESQRFSGSTGLQGGIGAGLVSSGADAKDGAHALKLGYGTIAAHDQVTKGTNAQQYKDLPNVSIPEAVREEREDLNRSAKNDAIGLECERLHSLVERVELGVKLRLSLCFRHVLVDVGQVPPDDFDIALG